MRIVNLTPHALIIFQGEEAVLAISPTGEVVRCVEKAQQVGGIETEGITVPLVSKSFGELEGLPKPVPGTIYVVSALAAQAAFKVGRNDVVCPGDPVRDDEGRVIGCRSLCGALPI